MKIFRTLFAAECGQEFLVDTEYSDGKIVLLKLHPVVDGVVWASLPLCQFENAEPLIGLIKEKTKTLA